MGSVWLEVGAAAPDVWYNVRGLRAVVSCSKGYEAPEPRGVVARVRAGDVGAAAPESGVCVCCNVALGRVVGKGSLRVRFFGLVFLINWATLLGFRSSFPHKLDQLSSSIMQSQSTWPSDEVP